MKLAVAAVVAAAVSGACVAYEGEPAPDGSMGSPTTDKSGLGFSTSSLPMRFRTGYALGGRNGCETVLTISNFKSNRVAVEVEFFDGHANTEGLPPKSGIAIYGLNGNEVAEFATSPFAPPYDIEAVRNTSAPFEGFATVHAAEAMLGVDAKLVCNLGNRETYGKINVFQVSDSGPVYHGD